MLVEAAVRLGTMPHAVVDVVPADRHVAQLDVMSGFKQVLPSPVVYIDFMSRFSQLKTSILGSIYKELKYKHSKLLSCTLLVLYFCTAAYSPS